MANTMARSFLQAAATSEEVAPPLRVVQIEGLAVLKIIKHCNEFLPALVTGQLLGLDVGSVLEVTNCFPFPIREEDEIEADGANYQLEMMRCLREVNVDNNTLGCMDAHCVVMFSRYNSRNNSSISKSQLIGVSKHWGDLEEEEEEEGEEEDVNILTKKI